MKLFNIALLATAAFGVKLAEESDMDIFNRVDVDDNGKVEPNELAIELKGFVADGDVSQEEADHVLADFADHFPEGAKPEQIMAWLESHDDEGERPEGERPEGEKPKGKRPKGKKPAAGAELAQDGPADVSEEVKEVFKKLDKNGNGSISWNELKQGLQKEFDESEEDADEIVSEVKAFFPGKDSFDKNDVQAFMNQMHSAGAELAQEEDPTPEEIFAHIDQNGNGELSWKEIKKALEDEDVDPEDIQEIKGELMEHFPGQESLSKEDFKKVVAHVEAMEDSEEE